MTSRDLPIAGTRPRAVAAYRFSWCAGRLERTVDNIESPIPVAMKIGDAPVQGDVVCGPTRGETNR